jgi:hypothetical protein
MCCPFHLTLNADARYVYPSEIKTFGSVSERQAMLTSGTIGQSWLHNYTTASRVPLHPSLGPINTDYPPPPSSPLARSSPLSHSALSFVHGGLAPEYPSLTPYPSRINELSRSLLTKLHRRSPQPPPHPPHPYMGLPPDATWEEAELYAGDGPVWYRGWAMESDDVVCRRVDNVLKNIGVRRLIMGHTPDFQVCLHLLFPMIVQPELGTHLVYQHIVSRCDGKIIIIDTGK